MVVKGLRLPDSFVRFLRAIREGRLPEEWVAKNGVDAYGHPCGASVMIYADERSMENATNSWWQSLPSEEDVREGTEWNGREPGFIPYVTDFSKVLCFGRTPSGEDVCFDYRDDPREPSVIYWDDTYWRRLAPSFDALLALLQSYDETGPYIPSDEEWADALPSRARVDEALSASYAQMSEAERKEVEEKMDQFLASQGVPAHQRRRKIEEALQRLAPRGDG